MPIRRRPTSPFRITEEPFPLTQLLSTPDSPQTIFDFVPEDFANAVLTPTYRLVDFPPRYYVVTIRYVRFDLLNYQSYILMDFQFLVEMTCHQPPSFPLLNLPISRTTIGVNMGCI